MRGYSGGYSLTVHLVRYSILDFKRFVGSLRLTGYNGHIILGESITVRHNAQRWDTSHIVGILQSCCLTFQSCTCCVLRAASSSALRAACCMLRAAHCMLQHGPLHRCIGCNIGVSDPLERESEAYLIAQNVTFFAVLTATCAML